MISHLSVHVHVKGKLARNFRFYLSGLLHSTYFSTFLLSHQSLSCAFCRLLFFLPRGMPGSCSPRGHRLQRDPQKQETRLPQSVLKHQNLFPFCRHKACQGILWVGSLSEQQPRRREKLQDLLFRK